MASLVGSPGNPPGACVPGVDFGDFRPQEVFGGLDHCNTQARRTPEGSLDAGAMIDHEFGCQRLPEPVELPHPIYDCGSCQYIGHRVTEVADALVVYVYCACAEIGHLTYAGL